MKKISSEKRFEKSLNFLQLPDFKFERLMCVVEFWEVFRVMYEGF